LVNQPDWFVNREIELVGYAIVGFETVHLAGSLDEVRVHEQWTALRPRERPQQLLVSLEMPPPPAGGRAGDLHGRKVVVRGRLLPPTDPSEPNPTRRWCAGRSFVVVSIAPVLPP